MYVKGEESEKRSDFARAIMECLYVCGWSHRLAR